MVLGNVFILYQYMKTQLRPISTLQITTIAIGVTIAIILCACMFVSTYTRPRHLEAFQYAAHTENIYFEIPQFLSHEECDDIIQTAIPILQKSLVVTDDGIGNKVGDFRSSEQAWLPHSTSLHNNSSAIENIINRVQDITHLPFTNFEQLQVVRYKKDGKYDPHYDSCDISDGVCKEFNPRRWTILIYLNDNFKCGETRFPHLLKSVKPVKGKALVFQVSDDNGHLFKNALHGGDPICEGEKWIATQWVRLHPWSR